MIHLIKPHLDALPSYSQALARGWLPSNVCGEALALEQIRKIATNPEAFVDSLTDPDARGAPIPGPNGSFLPRLPSITLWMWDGDFGGNINLRWQPGAQDLPPHVLGHIGYTVVPWKRRRGYASEALRQILPRAARVGLRYVELTCDPDNVASQHVIQAGGGVFLESFYKPGLYGSRLSLRYQIPLDAGISAC